MKRKNQRSQTKPSREGTYYTTAAISEKIGCSIDTLNKIIAIVVRKIAGGQWQKGKTRQHTPNEAFLIILARHLTYRLGFKEKEAYEIISDIYNFLIKESLLPESPLRLSDLYDIHDGKISVGIDNNGDDILKEIYNPDYYPVYIQIMNSVPKKDKTHRFYYKKYQSMPKKPVKIDGFDLLLTYSIEDDICVKKDGDFECDELTVKILPITEMLARFRYDFNCPGNVPSSLNRKDAQVF